MSDEGVFDVIDLDFDDFDPAGMAHLFEDTQSTELILSDSAPSWIGDIENMLMNDDDEEDAVDEDDVSRSFLDDFFSDVLLDVPVEDNVELTPSDQKSPQSDISDSIAKDYADAKTDADPDSKKRKRQLRNKDAALRSRERKKMYVKELEVKSRYLEGECRRLGRLLQCCYADNQDLRYRLHMGNDEAAGAAMTKQESAVLLLESLLLGSLFWFLGIICCLLHPSNLICLNQEAVVLQGIAQNDPRNVHPRKAKTNKIESPRFGTLFNNNRRCKGLRSKMKHMCRYTSILSVLS